MTKKDKKEEFVNMSTAEAVSAFKQYSEKTSEIVRNLAISGVVVSWLFFYNIKANSYDLWFLIPMIIFSVSLIFDLHQYATGKSVFHNANKKNPCIKKDALLSIASSYEKKRKALICGYASIAILIIIKFLLPQKFQIEGNIYNSVTKEPFSATIICESLPNHIIIDSVVSDYKTGAFSLMVRKNEYYCLTITKDKSFTESGYFNVDSLAKEGYQKTYKAFFLHPVFIKNDSLNYNIYFDVSKSYLRPESFAPINTAINFLKDDPSLKIKIAVFTDNSGSKLSNIKLGERRYTAVADYLMSNGISTDRVICENFGQDSAIALNNTYEGRQLNRRVTLKLLKK